MRAQVGTGGHTSYGGFGLYSRVAGLLLDRVVSAEVVTANGTVLTASNSSHPDLFWALRGAAPSYGIVTSWTFATLKAPPVLINYEIDFPNKLTKAQAVQIINAYQMFAASKPRNELSVLCPLGVDSGAVTIQFSGTYYGSLADFTTAIAPLKNALPGNPTMSTKQYNWYNGLTAITGPLSTTSPEPFDNFFAKSIVIDSPIASSSVSAWVDYMVSKGGNTGLWWWVQIDCKSLRAISAW